MSDEFNELTTLTEGGDPLSTLTPKQRSWLEYYLQTGMNATRACELAGYAQPNSVAHKIATSPKMKEAIKVRLEEIAMGANEIIARLSQQAGANIGEFFTIEADPVTGQKGPVWDWEKLKTYGYLVKSISATRDGWKVEFYDAQKALELLGRHLALFTDNVNMAAHGIALKAYIGVNPDDWDEPKTGE